MMITVEIKDNSKLLKDKISFQIFFVQIAFHFRFLKQKFGIQVLA